MSEKINSLPEKSINEKLPNHWNIKNDGTNFEKLLNHVYNTTNFKNFLFPALNPEIFKYVPGGLTVVDIGAGVGWVSAYIANLPTVKKLYILEPSIERFKVIPNVLKNFGCNLNKVEILNQDFTNMKLKSKIDIFILCAAIHHCLDSDIDELFKNIKKYLNNKKKYKYNDYLDRESEINFSPKILIINEHYLNSLVIYKRYLLYFLSKIGLHKKIYDWNNNPVGPGNWNSYYHYDMEHNRTKKEIIKIFKKYNFNYQIQEFKHSLLDKKIYNHNSKILKPLIYYNAVLTQN
tara:strand:+ start:64 stop:936 length:873 start_codon:yes stop_codon:yes gene_type:complete